MGSSPVEADRGLPVASEADMNGLLLSSNGGQVRAGMGGEWLGNRPSQAHYQPSQTHGRSFSHSAPTRNEHVGWGGQAIPDNGGYRVPWFGRSRGRATNSRNKPRPRGGNSDDRRGGKSPGYSRWGSTAGEADGAAREDTMSVEEVTSLVRSTRDGTPLPERLFQALHHFDSRTTSVLLKDLGKVGLGKRAVEIFDCLRRLEASHGLAALCDVYTYTAMISMCIYQHNVDRALELAQEMRNRNVERNVHTYTALMNVCIKCGKCHLALETYTKMTEDNIVPNVVTYNTLIDVYGKMGQWEQAVKVLALMKNEVRMQGIGTGLSRG